MTALSEDMKRMLMEIIDILIEIDNMFAILFWNYLLKSEISTIQYVFVIFSTYF